MGIYILKTPFEYSAQPPVIKIHMIARIMYNAIGSSKYSFPFFIVLRKIYIFEGNAKAIHIRSSIHPNRMETSFSEPKS